MYILFYLTQGRRPCFYAGGECWSVGRVDDAMIMDRAEAEKVRASEKVYREHEKIVLRRLA